jgi:hypothetical protein
MGWKLPGWGRRILSVGQGPRGSLRWPEPVHSQEGCLDTAGVSRGAAMPSSDALPDMLILLAMMVLAGLWFWKALQ